MPYRKGGTVKPHLRTVRTKSGTKTVGVRGTFRKSTRTKRRKK